MFRVSLCSPIYAVRAAQRRDKQVELKLLACSQEWAIRLRAGDALAFLSLPCRSFALPDVREAVNASYGGAALAVVVASCPRGDESLLRSYVRGGRLAAPPHPEHIEHIAEEVRNARRLFNINGWPVIDVTRRSVEETAAGILQYYNIWCERQ